MQIMIDLAFKKVTGAVSTTFWDPLTLIPSDFEP
jgi:hypothetical protein